MYTICPCIFSDKPECATEQLRKQASAVGVAVTMRCTVVANPMHVNFLWRKAGVTLISKLTGRIDDQFTVYSEYTFTPKYKTFMYIAVLNI